MLANVVQARIGNNTHNFHFLPRRLRRDLQALAYGFDKERLAKTILGGHATPAWQLLLAYALTAGFLTLMVWFCGRIYRIGILMYGKKPTLPEIMKWIKYA